MKKIVKWWQSLWEWKPWYSWYPMENFTDESEHVRENANSLHVPEVEGKWRPIPSDVDTVRYVSRYGGHCRDCADECGVCPSTGLSCESTEASRGIKHTIAALNYGFENGFLPQPSKQESE